MRSMMNLYARNKDVFALFTGLSEKFGIVQLPREHSSLTVSFHVKAARMKISPYHPPKVSKIGHKPSDGTLLSKIGRKCLKLNTSV